jgi:hypothetical protein
MTGHKSADDTGAANGRRVIYARPDPGYVIDTCDVSINCTRLKELLCKYNFSRDKSLCIEKLTAKTYQFGVTDLK